LYVFEKKKHAEIAKTLGISTGTSKSQLLRARKQIQKKLYNLVHERDKSGKKEKVLLTSMLLVMSKDYEYIDKFVYDKLEPFSAVPSLSAREIIRLSGKITEGISTGFGIKFGSVLIRKASWISLIVGGFFITGYLVLKTNNTNPGSNSSMTDTTQIANNSSDSAKNDLTDIPTETDVAVISERSSYYDDRISEQKNHVTPSKKVVVRKKLNIKKQIIIRDTIRVVDTISLQ
jgi:hypothetical protein